MIHCMGLLLYPVPPGFLQYLQLLQPKMYRFVGCFFKCCEDFFFFFKFRLKRSQTRTKYVQLYVSFNKYIAYEPETKLNLKCSLCGSTIIMEFTFKCKPNLFVYILSH